MYIVTEREQVIVTRLSKPVRIIAGERNREVFTALQEKYGDAAGKMSDVKIDMGAGLKFKLPFVERVVKYPDVLMEYDSKPERVVTRDKKVLIVDNFAQWRIYDPYLYSISVFHEVRARGVLDDIIYAIMREEIGKNDLIEVIRTSNRYLDEEAASAGADPLAPSATAQGTNPMKERIVRGRDVIMATVLERADARARSEYGIQIIDVRIKRADLVDENLQAVFGRMKAERDRVSKGYRSEGEKEAQIIRSTTDRDVAVLLSEAKRKAQETRGEADAEVVRIFAEAFGSNPELYRFMRSLEVVRDSTPIGSELIMDFESSIFNVLQEGFGEDLVE
jgi:membrane protease subunit HflC